MQQQELQEPVRLQELQELVLLQELVRLQEQVRRLLEAENEKTSAPLH